MLKVLPLLRATAVVVVAGGNETAVKIIGLSDSSSRTGVVIIVTAPAEVVVEAVTVAVADAVFVRPLRATGNRPELPSAPASAAF